MKVFNELEIFGDRNELNKIYKNFSFNNIKKIPYYITNKNEIKNWCKKNWGTDSEFILLNKILIFDRLDQKLSITFLTNNPPIQIINFFASKKFFLKFTLYFYDYNNFIYKEIGWFRSSTDYTITENL